MKYKITKQFARDTEKILAEFNEYQDAIFFIERKLLSDQEKHLNLIYRLFDDQKLLKDFNKEKITSTISPAQYAEGDNFLPNSIGPYKVSKDNQAIHALAGFVDLNDAELFVEDKLTTTKEEINYSIFNNGVLISTSNQRVKTQSVSGDTTTQAQVSSFRPTPLNVSPRPPGVPHGWVKDEKEDKK